jgi:hypothetical protein
MQCHGPRLSNLYSRNWPSVSTGYGEVSAAMELMSNTDALESRYFYRADNGDYRMCLYTRTSLFQRVDIVYGEGCYVVNRKRSLFVTRWIREESPMPDLSVEEYVTFMSGVKSPRIADISFGHVQVARNDFRRTIMIRYYPDASKEDMVLD